MKAVGLTLCLLLTTFSAASFAQSAAPTAPKSEAQKSFDTLKSFAGEWEGAVTLDPPMPEMADGKPLHVSMRVTSRGHAIVHELQSAGTPLDYTKYDHPVTMLYLDNDQLTLIHYCDAGNRPRMVARTAPDDKKVEFDLVDISGGTKHGHMHHAVFTPVDGNHHIEDWTYMMPGDKPIHAHFDLKRVQ
jgi:hypothetical protein